MARSDRRREADLGTTDTDRPLRRGTVVRVEEQPAAADSVVRELGRTHVVTADQLEPQLHAGRRSRATDRHLGAGADAAEPDRRVLTRVADRGAEELVAVTIDRVVVDTGLDRADEVDADRALRCPDP